MVFPREQFWDLFCFWYILMTYHIVWHIRNLECTQMIPAWRLPVLTLMNINYCLNHDLSNVYEWLSAKTEFMLIASRQKLSQFTESPSLTINENAIEEVRSAKSLGVYVDQNINWGCHIENISKKERIRQLTPFNVLIKVYNSLIQPHFDYCNVEWENCNKGLSEKLQSRAKSGSSHPNVCELW